MTDKSSEQTRRSLLATSAAALATLGLGRLFATDPAEAAAYFEHPEGPGSVSGAPHLPKGFRDKFKSRFVEVNGVRLHAVIGGEGPPGCLSMAGRRLGTNGAW